MTMARSWMCAQKRRGQAFVVLCVAALAALAAPVMSVPADPVASTTGPSVAPGTGSTATPSGASSQDVVAFFPAIKGDLTKLTWAHAVNSQALLNDALNSSVLMMEADVVLGKTPTSPAEVPVMGHPPDTTSDLALTDFIRNVIRFNLDHLKAPKGIKLDFKSIEVFEKSLDHLKQEFKTVPDFPVWLNADILAGPINATTTPVNAARFLEKAKTVYPDLMLSLGWTTRWGSGLDGPQDKVPVDQVKYSTTNVDAMIAAIKESGVNQPITYAVRAAFVAHSLPELQKLLANTPQASGKPTLTVWSSDDTDIVDAKQLRKNILALSKARVFVDVGDKLAKELNLASSGVSACASVATTFMALLAVMLKAL